MAWGKGGKSSKGKGKTKTKVIYEYVEAPWRVKSSFTKGGRKGKGKGKGKGKKPKKAFADLPEERKEEIREKHARIQEELGRETQGDTFYFGELLQRRKAYGWVKPSNFGKLPSEVQAKVKEMIKAKRASVKGNGSDNEVFKQNVLFLHMSDVEEGVKVQPGDRVKFKVYVDNEGAGAYEVSVKS
jgi:cold shock CspA family protein